jgi:hypothetical protein
MQRHSPKKLFIEPIKELRARVMDHIIVHGRSMVLGEDFDALLQQGSGKSFATLAFTADFLRLMSTCLLADRKLDPLEVQFLFPLVAPACKLYGKYRPEYNKFADINRGNIHHFLAYYNSDTSLFGFRCPVTRWGGIIIANNVAAKCGDNSFRVIARDYYSAFGDALCDISRGEEVSLIIENMLEQFDTSTAEVDDDLDFDTEWVAQTTGFSCAVVSQLMILKRFQILSKSMPGAPVTEAELVHEAAQQGWLDQDGTYARDSHKLLEHYGVATHQDHAPSVGTLFDELRQGHMVLVFVDSGELTGTDSPWEDVLHGEIFDHAILVVGMDFSDSSNPMVVVNDPGAATEDEGKEIRYPIAQFIDAWSDSQKFYVATDHPPPDLTHDPIVGLDFNQEEGLYMNNDFWDEYIG